MTDDRFRRLIRSALMLAMASCSQTSGSSQPASSSREASLDDAGAADAGNDATAACEGPTLPPADTCASFVAAPCSLADDGGVVELSECKKICPERDGGSSEVFNCYAQRSIYNDPKSARYVVCEYCVIGRRPEGLGACADADGEALGIYFARASQLEAASIDAFRMLEGDLIEHGAPSDLQTRARRAARDEVRHAKATAKLARRHGAKDGAWSDAPSVEPRRARTLEEVAIENATEGCVREAFGALVGMWQAEHAKDETIRRAMRGIARDETRHAALAWSVLAWTRGELDDEARARVDGAMNDALATLEKDVVVEPIGELREKAGLPSAREAAALVGAFRDAIVSL